MLFKIKAFNEHRQFFIKDEGLDMLFKSKKLAEEFMYCIRGIYWNIFQLNLEVTDENGNKC